MDYPTLLSESTQVIQEEEPATRSLYELCCQLTDGRQARGKRYELGALLTLLVLAKLAGMKSVLGASEWISDQQERLCRHLSLSWKRMPCATTYSYALASLESQPIQEHLAAWLIGREAQSRCGEEPSRLLAHAPSDSTHLAIDGKALRGTGIQAYGGEEPQKQLLHIYEVKTGIVLHQCPIERSHNEVSTLKPLLTSTLCQGRVLTADAAQSYHEFGRLVKRAGGDVIVTIKENTPRTYSDLELFFEDEEADCRTWQGHEHIEKGHGRIARRVIFTSPDLNEYLRLDWGEVGQVFRLQRERRSKREESLEVSYGWTSLSPQQCPPQQLLQRIRDHWAVENRLHWRRDVTLGDDSCGVRLQPVAQMLAVLNSLVLSLMDLHQVTNVARQIRRFVSCPQEALSWVL